MLLGGEGKFIADAADVEDFEGGGCGEVFAQFVDEAVQAIEVVIVVVLPDAIHEGPGFHDLVRMPKQFVDNHGLDMRQLDPLISDRQPLGCKVECAIT